MCFVPDFAENRLKLAEILYYKVLENVLAQENRRLNGKDMSVSIKNQQQLFFMWEKNELQDVMKTNKYKAFPISMLMCIEIKWLHILRVNDSFNMHLE